MVVCIFAELEVEGEVMSSFVVNESPVFGKCTILPDSGVEMDTEFNVLCTSWQDNVSPLH